MALHKNFPKLPHEVLDLKIRWFPADEALRENGYEKLLPPLVLTLRQEIKKWRDNNYERVSNTSRALLQWWFQIKRPKKRPHYFVFCSKKVRISIKRCRYFAIYRAHTLHFMGIFENISEVNYEH